MSKNSRSWDSMLAWIRFGGTGLGLWLCMVSTQSLRQNRDEGGDTSCSNGKTQRINDFEMYKRRHSVENFIGKVKQKGGSRRNSNLQTAATR